MSTRTHRNDELGLVIEIELELAASPVQVFHRWTDAEALARWFAPPGYATISAKADARPGGAWQLDFRSESGDHEYTERGMFREVEPVQHLVFTLTQVDGGQSNPETLVTVSLTDAGTATAPRTLLRLTQSGYRSWTLRNDNEQGWQGCLVALAHDLATQHPGASDCA